MNRKIILPTTVEEIAVIRKHPEKPVDFPTYSKQKVGIIIYSLMLLFALGMLFVGFFSNELDWSLYLLIFLPLTYVYDLLYQFAFTEDGVLCGGRFIPWGKIKSYSFIAIDLTHKYYGFSKEANNGYELKIKSKLNTVSCVITTDDMKDRLDEILQEHIKK